MKTEDTLDFREHRPNVVTQRDGEVFRQVDGAAHAINPGNRLDLSMDTGDGLTPAQRRDRLQRNMGCYSD